MMERKHDYETHRELPHIVKVEGYAPDGQEWPIAKTAAELEAVQTDKAQRQLEAKREREAAQARAVFAKGLHPYKLTWIFTVGCFLGYIVEMLFCIFYHGKIETRQGLIYGPFSQIYGIGALIMTLTLVRIENRRKLDIFLICALIGGVFEFTCSVIQEYVFGSKSWDFSDQTFHFGGRTSLMFMCFWGALGLFFIKMVYPRFSDWVERMPIRLGTAMTWVLILFFAFDIVLSATAVSRWNQRQKDVPARNAYHAYLDESFPDQRMEKIYPQIQFVE